MRPTRCQLRYRRCSYLEITLESHAPAASTCKGQSTLLLPIALNCPTCCHERHFAFAADAKNMVMTAVGFEPTPFRTGAWSQRLRPLGQTVSATLLGHPGQETPSRHAACHGEERVCQGQHLVVFCTCESRVCENAETRDRTGDLQIFSLTLSQLSYRGNWTMIVIVVSSR